MRQATLVPLVPVDPPAVIVSLIMSPDEKPPAPTGGTAGPPPTTPDTPVTPNVIEAESMPKGSLTRPASKNVTAPVESMLLPCPASPGFAAATAEAERSPVTQLPDAEASELIEPPMGGVKAHEIGPVLAELNPL